MDTYANAQPTKVVERALRIGGGGDRIVRARERDQEAVALDVDLDPVVRRDRGPEAVAVLLDLLPHPFAPETGAGINQDDGTFLSGRS